MASSAQKRIQEEGGGLCCPSPRGSPGLALCFVHSPNSLKGFPELADRATQSPPNHSHAAGSRGPGEPRARPNRVKPWSQGPLHFTLSPAFSRAPAGPSCGVG